MTRSNRVLVFLAAVLAVGLIARPHLETVYIEEAKIRDAKGETQWGFYDVFRSEAKCRADATEGNNSAADVARMTKTFLSYRCRPDVRFSWGW